MNINSLLMLVSGGMIVVIVFIMYQKAKLRTATFVEEDFSTLDKLLESVKLEMLEMVKEDYSLGLSDTEFNALYKRKARINEALKNCVYGIDNAKIIVIELIRGFIQDNVPSSRVEELLGLSSGMEPSDHVKFEILMYMYKKKYGKDALSKWIDKYNFARERKATYGKLDSDTSYYITIEDLHSVYEEESIKLSVDEKVDVLAVLIYQLYKGFGIVDTIREMNVNGFNCGTSGSIMQSMSKQVKNEHKAVNAFWLYYNGKYVHFRFMNFGTEEELRRIIQLLVRYGNPGPLTAKRGYLVNTMYDKSRILALRPPASEYWAVFVRKFTLSDVSPEALIMKSYTRNGELAVKLIEFLMRGQITCAFTGRQGSGKTTLMSSVIRFIDNRYTLRVLEMAPELYLRELYPTRNILSVQETSTVSAAELQDALKKSDAAVSIVGEVATDSIAARMIQMGQVASIFTIFSHHANTARDLVFALRNSLVNAGGFSNMTTAERQVTEVVKVDVHLDYTTDGKRYVDRISEIIPLDEKIPYPDYDPQNHSESTAKITKEYYERTTDRVSFITKDIVKYDVKTHTYNVVNRFSVGLEEKIRLTLGDELRRMYDKFVFSNWGKRIDDEVDEVAVAVMSRFEEDLAVEQVQKAEDEALEKLRDEIIGGLKQTRRKKVIRLGKNIISCRKRGMSDEQKDEAMVMFDFFDGEVRI